MYKAINFVKTSILFAALTALLIIVGYLLAGKNGAELFFLISLIFNLGSYWFSDKIALSMAGAQPLDEAQYSWLYEDVRDIASKMDLPAPLVIYASAEAQPNAFATGRNKNHSAICVTRGLLNTLNRNEIKAVLGHEMGHVKNHDVLLSTIAAVIAGTISSIINIIFIFGGDNEEKNPFASILLIILAPITATLLQLAISRSREYAADATGSEYTGMPKELANALIQIDRSVKQIPMNVNPGISSLYIQNPLPSKEGLIELFSTHPSTENRVARLMQMQENN